MAGFEVLNEIKKLKNSSNPRKTATSAGLSLSLRTGNLRSVYWKIFLGILPLPTTKSDEWLEEWEDETLDTRDAILKAIKAAKEGASGAGKSGAKEEAKKKSRFGDSDSEESSDGEVAEADPHDDPLSTHTNSKYQLQFQREKAVSGIDKDISRLWCDDPFFDDEDLKDQIRNVLVRYCLDGAGAALGYRQGMHEVLSLVFLVLTKDCDAITDITVKPSMTAEDKEDLRVLRSVCNRNFIEHDAQLIFERIMEGGKGQIGLSDWYGITNGSPSQPSSPNKALDIGQSALSKMDDMDEDNLVVAAAHIVQRNKLSQSDEKLARHLNQKLSIPPQSYLLRWLRLLFIREFSFSQCALAWDALFAEMFWTLTEEGKDEYLLENSFVIDLSVQMLLFISNDLLEADYAFALRRLMRYPPVEDASMIIQRALRVRHKAGSPILLAAGLLPKREPSPEQPAASSSGAATPTYADPTSAPATQPVIKSGSVPPAIRKAPGTESADELRDRQLRVGLVLANVVTRMEAMWFPNPDATPEEKAQTEDDYVLAIAELKKSRDVLLNNVSDMN